MYLFLAFVLLPIVEIGLFIKVGGLIGLWPTLAIVVGSAMLGSWLMRTQGRVALAEVQRAFNEMRDPGTPLAHGAMIIVAGMLLITPGLLTDTMGLLLLIPAVRLWVMRTIRARMNVQVYGMNAQGGARYGGRPGDDIIDGDYREVDPSRGADRPKTGPSGWVRGPDDTPGS
ncbi:FxsA family protein [Chachezhania sediminis]|uniref:FxsA family protein n=1 Tax=Chachezhania sediminis TaxID=2599291 RepID=UPI00131B0430|nr:FxsA family protein [Chachezhania sediminis]